MCKYMINNNIDIETEIPKEQQNDRPTSIQTERDKQIIDMRERERERERERARDRKREKARREGWEGHT